MDKVVRGGQVVRRYVDEGSSAAQQLDQTKIVPFIHYAISYIHYCHICHDHTYIALSRHLTVGLAAPQSAPKRTSSPAKSIFETASRIAASVHASDVPGRTLWDVSRR